MTPLPMLRLSAQVPVGPSLRRLLPLLALGLASAWAGAARASGNAFARQPGGMAENEDSISPMLGLSGWYGLEVGVKADYLLASPAFIPALNNAVFLEGSVFLAQKHVFLAPLLRWDFNLHPQWTLYGEAGIEVDARLASGDNNQHDSGPLGLVAQVGAIWRLPGKTFYLRGEIDGTHNAVRVGPVFPL